MIASFQSVSILPAEGEASSTAFLEVIAYLRGVADTVSAQTEQHGGPLSLRPLAATPSLPAASLPPGLLRSFPLSIAPRASLAPSSEPAAPRASGVPARFGDLPFERGSVWPQVSVGSSWEPTRGGARMIDPGSVRPIPESDSGGIWRRTLPYGSPTVSLAACPPSIPAWDFDERASEVRLRTVGLPPEWYELTGTESLAGR